VKVLNIETETGKAEVTSAENLIKALGDHAGSESKVRAPSDGQEDPAGLRQ
jgi:hypothetical protein